MPKKQIIILILLGLFFLVKPVSVSASTIRYIHSDHLGSVSMVTDKDGTIVSRTNYYPYGAVRHTEGESPTEKGYTGQVSDYKETGLMYYNARYYDPVTARFTQADTMEGPNRYAYVRGNPIKYNDPTGHTVPPNGITDWIEKLVSSCPDEAKKPTNFYEFLDWGWARGLSAIFGGPIPDWMPNAANLQPYISKEDAAATAFASAFDINALTVVMPSPDVLPYLNKAEKISEELLEAKRINPMLEGENATIHIMSDGNTVVKMGKYTDPSAMNYINKEYEVAKEMEELVGAPKVFGQVESSSGRLGFAMERRPGLPYLEGGEAYLNQRSLEQLREKIDRIKKAGYDVPDFQFLVEPDGTVHIFDFGSYFKVKQPAFRQWILDEELARLERYVAK